MNNGRPPPGFEGYRPGTDAAGRAGPGPVAPQRRPGPPTGPPPGGPPRRPGGRRKKAKRKSGGFGTILLFLGIGLMALLGAGVAVLAIAPPTDFIRDQLIQQVAQNTNRKLEITGRTGLTFYPALGFSMEGVRLSAPPEMGGGDFVKMKSLTVQVKLLPLLSKNVVVDRFVLEKPEFDLIVDEAGRKNWEFAEALVPSATQRRIRLAQAGGQTSDAIPVGAGAAAAPSGGVDIAQLENVALGDVRIIDGVVRYVDKKADKRERVEDIDVSLNLSSIGEPLNAEGNLSYKRQRIDFNTRLTSIKTILEKQPANLDASFKSEHISGAYDGTLDVASDLKLNGRVNLSSPSARKLTRWLGTKLPKARGFGPFSLKGRLSMAGNTIKLANADLGLDGATGSGDVTVNTGGPRPKISGALQLSELDLNKYMPPSGSGGPDEPTPGTPANETGSPMGGGMPSSIEDLLGSGTRERGGPQVRGYTARHGWSTEAIDFSGLGAADADLDLTVGKLLYEKIKVGRSNIKVDLANSNLTARVNELQLYEGTGKGVLRVDARKTKPTIGANFNLTGVSAQPLLTDAIELDWLAGKGQVLLALTTAGNNQLALVNTLNGTAKLEFRDGAVVGVNVPRIVRAVQQGRFDQIQGAPAEKTDFSELTASFNITNGTARNEDLTMLSPLLRVTGQGDVVLPEKRIDYTVRPKAVANLSGQGGRRGLSGLEVPVRIHGPFDNLKYTPDLSGVLSDPGKAADVVRQLGGGNAGKVLDKALDSKAGKAIKDLLGGGGAGGQDGGGKVDAGKLLDGLFGGGR